MGHPKRPKSEAEKKVIERVRAMCTRLLEVEVATDGFGHTSFRVGKKPFTIVGGHEDGAPSLAVKADVDTQEALVRRGGYHRTPYIGQHGWVSVDKGTKIDWPSIEELVVDAYRRTAPKRLARAVQ